MKIHLVNLRQDAFDAMVARYESSRPRLHTLVDDPADADMILFVGGGGVSGEGVVDSPLPKKYPEKCFSYGDEDDYVALLPGVYPNAEMPILFDLRRISSQTWIHVLNPHVHPMQAEKKYLFSFAGGSTSLVRKRLYRMKYRRPDVHIENTSSYYHWDPSQHDREERQKRYAEVIASSKFGLVPKGASAGSLRLWETMQMGVPPVVISDKWMLPYGPKWESFAIRIPQRKLAKVDTILEKYEHESVERGRLARIAYEEYFAPDVFFNRVVEDCERERINRRIPERWIHPLWGYMLWRQRSKNGARGFAKSMVLKVFKLMGKRFIYEMNTR